MAGGSGEEAMLSNEDYLMPLVKLQFPIARRGPNAGRVWGHTNAETFPLRFSQYFELWPIGGLSYIQPIGVTPDESGQER